MTPPVTIVTGFLGSGKTTMLRKMLASIGTDRRIGLIVNEIGAIGFDGAALQGSSELPLVELTAGCICCAAGSDFLLAVEQLIDYAEPDVIVIETTGIAEPGGMIRQARAADLPLDAVIAVAGAADLDAALRASPVAEQQLRSADLIALSKIDLTDDAGAAAIAQLRTLNPRAAIIPADQLATTPSMFFAPRFQADPPADPQHRAHDHFETILWEYDEPLQRAALTAALDQLPSAVYRAKGRVCCSDSPWPDELQFVAGRHTLRAERAAQRPQPLNQLVLIGPHLNDRRAEIQRILNACADSAERAAAWWQRQKEVW